MDPTLFAELRSYIENGVEPLHVFVERTKERACASQLSIEVFQSMILAKVESDIFDDGINPIEVFASMIYCGVHEDALEPALSFMFDECAGDLSANSGVEGMTYADNIAYMALIKSCEIGGIPAAFPRPMLFDLCFKKGHADFQTLVHDDLPEYKVYASKGGAFEYGFWGMVIFTGISSMIETLVDAGLDINTRVQKLESADGKRYIDPMSFALTLCPAGYNSCLALLANNVKVEEPSLDTGAIRRHACIHICTYERGMQRARPLNNTDAAHKDMLKQIHDATGRSFRQMLEHGYSFGIDEFLFVLEIQSLPHLKEMIRHAGNDTLVQWVMVSASYEKAYESLVKRTKEIKSRKTYVGKWFFEHCEPLQMAQLDKKREEQKQQRKEALEKKKAAQEAERAETKRRQEAALQEQRAQLEQKRQQIKAEERRQAEEKAKQQALEREKIAKEEEEKRMAEQKRAEFFERIEQVKKMNLAKEKQRQGHLEEQEKEAKEVERRLALQRKQQEKLADLQRAKQLKLNAANAKAEKVEKAQAVKITVVSPPRVFSAPTKALLSNMASSNKQLPIPEENDEDDTKSTFSIATTAVPLPHPTHHFGERVEERSADLSNVPDLAREIKWTLKHGNVTPGNKANTVVHRGRSGGLDIVTDKSASVAVSVWPAARPPSPVGSQKSTCSIASSSSSIKSSASSQMGSALASSNCLKCESKSRDWLACVACFHISLCADCAIDDQPCMCCNQTLGYRRVFVA